jgi:hypothetical protein
MIRLPLLLALLLPACVPDSQTPGPDGSQDAEPADPGDLGPSAPGDLAGVALLAVDDTSFQFDPVAGAPHSPAQTFKVTNLGGQPSATLQVDIHGNDEAQFHVDSDDCSGKSLAPAASCHVAVTLGVGVPGDFAATLRVHGDPGGVARVDLSGIVVDAALAMKPATLDLGAVFQGASSTATISVVNTGGAFSGVLSLGALDQGFTVANDGCTGQILAGGASCPVTVEVSAGANATGAVSSALHASAQPGGAATAMLDASVHPIGTLTITDIDFGTVGILFGTAANQTATVKNVGEQSTYVSGVTMNGASYSFSQVSDGCTGKTLQPGDTCPIVIGLPANRYTGTQQAGLLVSVSTGHGATGKVKVIGSVDGYQVNVGVSAGSGTISSPDGQTCSSSSCTFKFQSSNVTLTATPATNFNFSQWDGTFSDYACPLSTNAVCQVMFSPASYIMVAEARFTAKP